MGDHIFQKIHVLVSSEPRTGCSIVTSTCVGDRKFEENFSENYILCCEEYSQIDHRVESRQVLLHPNDNSVQVTLGVGFISRTRIEENMKGIPRWNSK
jgi:hypothetical protein